MSQKERDEKRRERQIAEATERMEQARKLRLRPIACMVRALFQRPDLWRTA